MIFQNFISVTTIDSKEFHSLSLSNIVLRHEKKKDFKKFEKWENSSNNKSISIIAWDVITGVSEASPRFSLDQFLIIRCEVSKEKTSFYLLTAALNSSKLRQLQSRFVFEDVCTDKNCDYHHEIVILFLLHSYDDFKYWQIWWLMCLED